MVHMRILSYSYMIVCTINNEFPSVGFDRAFYFDVIVLLVKSNSLRLTFRGLIWLLRRNLHFSKSC